MWLRVWSDALLKWLCVRILQHCVVFLLLFTLSHLYLYSLPWSQILSPTLTSHIVHSTAVCSWKCSLLPGLLHPGGPGLPKLWAWQQRTTTKPRNKSSQDQSRRYGSTEGAGKRNLCPKCDYKSKCGHLPKPFPRTVEHNFLSAFSVLCLSDWHCKY